jgi:L-asparaginase II
MSANSSKNTSATTSRKPDPTARAVRAGWPRAEPLAEATRGNALESWHHGIVVLCDPRGQILFSLGDPECRTFLRSCAKPFQAMPLVESGGAQALSLSDAELAVVCGSHNGERKHVNAARSILEKIGAHESELYCGASWPALKKDQENYIRAKGEPLPIFHNCSGKHAGMLALCHFRKIASHHYWKPDHPVQEAIRSVLADLSELPAGGLASGTDGCGVPNYTLPLSAAARMFACLADPSGLPEGRRKAIERIRKAMTGFPDMVAGTDRFDTALMKATRGRILSKAGGEGVEAFAIPSLGIGGVVKILDGNFRAAPPVTVEILNELGCLDAGELKALKEFHHPPVRSGAGEPVGEVRPLPISIPPSLKGKGISRC